MAEAALPPKLQFFDSNGDPLSGGFLYTYIAGTSTPLATYTDNTGGTPNANPVVLDSRGEADVWLGANSYKFVLKDSDDNTIYTVDNITQPGSSSSGESGWTEHAISDGQSATDLTGETVDLDDYSSAIYEVEIIRGTTCIAYQTVVIQDLNGTGRVIEGAYLTNVAVNPLTTFSVSQGGTVVQLRAATTAGPGSGTIKLRKTLVAQSS